MGKWNLWDIVNLKMLRDLWGEKWGVRIGRFIFVVFVGTGVVWCLRTVGIWIVDSSNHISRTSPTIERVAILTLSMLLMVGGAIAFAWALGRAIREVVSSLSTHTIHKDIKDALNDTVTLLEQTNKELPNREECVKLLERAKKIKAQWESSQDKRQ